VDLFTSAQLALWSERIVVTPAVRLLTASEFDPAVTPKLGLVLRPFGRSSDHWAGGFEVLANAGRSYRYPTFQELYLRLEGLYPNPDLLPEDAWSIDAGFRWSLSRLLRIELAYYQRWLNNTILYAPTGSFRVTADNYSEVRANGVEAAVDLEPGLCLALKSAYTYTKTRFSNPERALPGHPEHQLTGRLEWAGRRCIPSTWYRARGKDGRSQRGWWSFLRGLRVWGEAVGQSEMPLDRNNSETLFEEGRVLIALGGSYTHGWLTVAAQLRNLTDKRDAVDTLGFPLPPRNFFVSTTARF
jgi:outer membrane receptor protein involved in Fe transport